jgi:hypothetical protein
MTYSYQNTHINFIDILKMHQTRPSRESIPESAHRGSGTAPVIVRTDLSSLLSDYTTSQRRCMYYSFYFACKYKIFQVMIVLNLLNVK